MRSEVRSDSFEREIEREREREERRESVAMGGTLAEHRRALLPFLQRAEEVSKAAPKVAYYCRLYAVEEGLKLQNRDKAIEELLFSVMDKLEQFKAKNALNPEEDKLQLEGFALKIFSRADRVDRAGKADMSTCKAFYAASVFMEVCTQFGELDEDLEGKQKYAAWRAADIRKALREGRTPAPPAEPKSYSPGQKVVCKLDESSLPVQGTVLSSMGNKFMVSLPGGTQEVSSSKLALDAVPGTSVMYRNASGVEQEGKILSMDVTVWPPSYEVERSDGVSNTEEKNITVVAAPEPSAPAVPQSPSHSKEEQTGNTFDVNDLSLDDASVSAPPAPSLPTPPSPAPILPKSPATTPKPRPAAQPSYPSATSSASTFNQVPGFVPGLLQMNDAQRQAKVAISSLGFQDYKSAIEYLQKALKLLTSPQ